MKIEEFVEHTNQLMAMGLCNVEGLSLVDIKSHAEKQTPKMISVDEFGWNECPNHCTLSGLISKKYSYCPYCGQKLKWSK